MPLYDLLDMLRLMLIGMVLVIFMLVGSYVLLGWFGPVLLIVAGAWYGWWDARRA